MSTDAENDFLERTCLPFLRNSQNADGGWGFRPGAESRAEGTAWATLALAGASDAGDANRGAQFLRHTQLGDGSWPATPGDKTGCWVTSLACLALNAVQVDSRKQIRAGLRWICDDWPQDSTAWRRFLMRISSDRGDSPINISYRGWSWTPGTSSWVEPTALALLALEQTPEDLRPPGVNKRRALAEAMLYDRMCAGGGWNSGNPRVYGVTGEPLAAPTSFALLALRAHSQRKEIVESLAWLERDLDNIQSAGSLALARICLDAYGRPSPAAAKFSDLYGNSEFLQNVLIVAWTCLALSGPSWLGGLRAKVA
jgi:hypothetical protein